MIKCRSITAEWQYCRLRQLDGFLQRLILLADLLLILADRERYAQIGFKRTPRHRGDAVAELLKAFARRNTDKQQVTVSGAVHNAEFLCDHRTRTECQICHFLQIEDILFLIPLEQRCMIGHDAVGSLTVQLRAERNLIVIDDAGCQNHARHLMAEYCG